MWSEVKLNDSNAGGPASTLHSEKRKDRINYAQNFNNREYYKHTSASKGSKYIYWYIHCLVFQRYGEECDIDS